MVVHRTEGVLSDEIDNAGDAVDESFCCEELVSMKLSRESRDFLKTGITVIVQEMDDAVVCITDSNEEDFGAFITPRDTS